jgi:aminoglycoside 6'-N-acetyltransferase I
MAKDDIRITDMPGDDTHVEQAADVLWSAFCEHWPNAWPTREAAIEEVRGMHDGRRICRAALLDGRVVGWIGGIPEYDGNVWELHPLAVAPEAQERGIGRALVEDFEREVAKRGGLTIMLGTDDESGMTSLSGVNLYEDLPSRIAHIRNLRRHPYGFYERLGFTVVGVIPDANGRGKPDIYMAKSVAGRGKR